MFLLTQSSNNFVLSNLANVKSRNIIAIKQVISRIFTGLDIINKEEMQQIAQGCFLIKRDWTFFYTAVPLTRIRPEIADLKNRSTNVHKPGLLGALSTSHSCWI